MTTRDTQQQIGGLVNVSAGICQDLNWAVTSRAPHKKGLRELRRPEDTDPNGPDNDTLIFALARNFPLWLHSRLHTSSVCTCSIVVVTHGKRSASHVWSAIGFLAVGFVVQVDRNRVIRLTLIRSNRGKTLRSVCVSSTELMHMHSEDEGDLTQLQVMTFGDCSFPLRKKSNRDVTATDTDLVLSHNYIV